MNTILSGVTIIFRKSELIILYVYGPDKVWCNNYMFGREQDPFIIYVPVYYICIVYGCICVCICEYMCSGLSHCHNY